MLQQPFSIFLLLLLFFSTITSTDIIMEKFVSFPYIDFWFHKWELHEHYIQQQIYKQVIPHTIRLYRNQIYASFPRKLSPQVPITLGKMLTKYDFLSPVLENRFLPYPSWEMNQPTSKNETLFSVLGFEIDTQSGIMYILDQGQTSTPGTMKIIRYDLEKEALIDSLVFPNNVINEQTSSLDQIVVDPVRNMAYVSDSGAYALLVVDFSSHSVRRLLSQDFTTKPDPSLWITYQNGNKKCLNQSSYRVGIHALARSCDFQRLYWSPLTSKSLYMLSTLQNFTTSSLVISVLGNTNSIMQSMLCNTNEELLMANVETNQIYRFEEQPTYNNISRWMQEFTKREELMQWPSSMSYGTNGYLYILSNQWCSVLNKEIDFKNPNNFIIWRAIAPGRNYIEGCNQVRGDILMQYIAIGFLVGTTILGVILLIMTLICYAPHVHFYIPQIKDNEDSLDL